MLLNSSLYVAHTRGKFTQTGSSCKIQLPISYFGVKFPLCAFPQEEIFYTGSSCKIQLPISYFGVKFPLCAFPQEEIFYTVSLYKAGEGKAGPVPATVINLIMNLIVEYLVTKLWQKVEITVVCIWMSWWLIWHNYINGYDLWRIAWKHTQTKKSG